MAPSYRPDSFLNISAPDFADWKPERQTVEQINVAFAQYTAAQKLAVKAMCEKYETIKAGWNVANILAWTE